MDFHNVNEVLAEIEKMSIKTSQGSFVRTEDVKKLLSAKETTEEAETKADEKTSDIKNFDQARVAAKKDPEFLKHFDHKPTPGLGRAASASL